MLLKKRQYNFAQRLIQSWEQNKVITSEIAQNLSRSIQILAFDWKRLAKYSFWIAGICMVISTFALLFDEAIMALLKRILQLPDSARSIILFVLAAIFYFWSFNRKRKKPTNYFTNESLLFIGALFTAPAIIFLGKAVDTGSGHFSILILLGSIIYLSVGGLFPSAAMWTLGLLSLGTWFGTETGYLSDWGAYFLGMNYPARFITFGIVLVALSFIFKRTTRQLPANATYIVGLLNLFIALWLMSIFGNYGDMTKWHQATHMEVFLFSLLFGIAAFASILWGLKADDSIARGFGIVFLFINFYTKYFEYFWNTFHKAIFFGILAASFWFIGKYSEKAWIKLKQNLINSPDEN